MPDRKMGSPFIPLDDGCFAHLGDLLNRRCGIVFKPRDKNIVESRLQGRLAALGCGSFAEYRQLLENEGGEGELTRAIELLTNNETYFFREDYQLTALRDHVLPRLARRAKNKRKLTLWSAGCSSGEEVYTLAIILVESGLFSGWDIRVFGSDISARMIAKARKGVYTESSFRNMPFALRRKYFSQEGNRWKVADAIRCLCNFAQINLVQPEQSYVIGNYDVIFCRNVLMYFDKRSRMVGLDVLFHRLHPGGLLFLGHTESLWNVDTPFVPEHIGDALVYRRPEVLP